MSTETDEVSKLLKDLKAFLIEVRDILKGASPNDRSPNP
jgi:hypothetical protein